jgi:sugar phosphate isomerase/epimerase
MSMKRRDFLASTAGIIGAAGLGAAQGQPPASGRQGGVNPALSQLFPGRTTTPAPVAPHKLARISLMQLQFEQYQRPLDPKVTATPEQTLAMFDLPKMYVDMYGCHNIEFQLNNVVQSETDPDFITRLKAALDEHKVTMSQINMEIGSATGMTADAAGRRRGIDRLKKWIDIANQYGCKRLMLNQDQANLTKDRKADAVAYMKELADAGRPSGVMFSVETRGGGNPELIKALGMKPWEFMADIIEEAGAHSNVDTGNIAAANQEELHACIKRWFKTSSGNMHIKSHPNFSMYAAVRYTESLGYKGLYALEILFSGHAAIRVAYNEVLAGIA